MSPSVEIVSPSSHVAAYFLYFLNRSHGWCSVINKEQASSATVSMQLLKPILYPLEYLSWSIRYSTVVFWVARDNPSPCHNHRLLGEQRGEEIVRPLPEFEALVGIQDQPLNECLRLLTTRCPNGFDGEAPFCR
jgi:hypothetical protein